VGFKPDQVEKFPGPGGRKLIGWKNPTTGQTAGINIPGLQGYTVPLWGPAPQTSSGGGHRGSSSSGGGHKGGGGTQLPSYKGLLAAIKNDLRAPVFNEGRFRSRAGVLDEGSRIQAEKARRAVAGRLGSQGNLSSGAFIENLKDIGEAESRDIGGNLEQLAEDERSFLTNTRLRGLESAERLFSNQLRGITAQDIAKANRDFSARLGAQQLEFSRQQSALDRALQREQLNILVSQSNRGGGNNFLSGLLGSIGGGINLGSTLRGL